MEEEIRPKILQYFKQFRKKLCKITKISKEKLECILSSKDLSVSKNKNFKKIQQILVDNFKNLN